MIDIQPIETAPKDGSPILTDEGWVKWYEIFSEWNYCTPDGMMFCDEEGPFRARPKFWTPTKIFQ
jgi:hypothetical protein